MRTALKHIYLHNIIGYLEFILESQRIENNLEKYNSKNGSLSSQRFVLHLLALKTPLGGPESTIVQ